MTPQIAKEIANLLNSQNQLGKIYTAKDLLDHGDRYLVRTDDQSKVLGFVEVKKVQWYQCEIDHLSVVVKGQGMGSLLLADAITKATEMGARVAQCTIRVGNEASEGLFMKFGFTPCVTFTNAGTGNRVRTYQKSLTP